jgi:hypothetical protein
MYICTRNTEVTHFIEAISSAGSEHPDKIGRVRVRRIKKNILGQLAQLVQSIPIKSGGSELEE